jgi:hypothetical protein
MNESRQIHFTDSPADDSNSFIFAFRSVRFDDQWTAIVAMS